MVESQSSGANGIDNAAERISGNEGGYVIVITRWNEGIVNGLLAGAQQALQQMGIADDKVRVVTVPVLLRCPWHARRRPRERIATRLLPLAR